MILGRDLLKPLGLYLELSKQVISGDDGTYEGRTVPMVDMCTYYYKKLNWNNNVKPEELIMNVHVEEIIELENIPSLTKILWTILDEKYEKSDLNIVMNEQCQHLLEDKRNYLIRLLQQFEYWFD